MHRMQRRCSSLNACLCSTILVGLQPTHHKSSQTDRQTFVLSRPSNCSAPADCRPEA